MYRIFNHSSERMPEIGDDAIDMAVLDPPYNVGLEYYDSVDRAEPREYFRMLEGVMDEISRIVKPGGLVLFLAPVMVRQSGRDLEYSGMVEKEFKARGFFLVDSHDIVAEGEEHAVSVKDWKSQGKADMHSEELKLLAFSRTRVPFTREKARLRFSFRACDGHPCPFGERLVDFIIRRYFRKGCNVLDPFMGIARLGRRVLDEGGNYFGYEIRERFFEAARRRLGG
jgi:DNA modification methylase